VIDEEWEHVAPALLEATCMIGTADELATRLRVLGDVGLSQVVLLPPLEVKDDVLRSVATEVVPLLR
jgi:hypothetical protein